MIYMLRHIKTGKLVAAPGGKHSYTVNPRAARKFESHEEARADACSNEEVISLEDYKRGY